MTRTRAIDRAMAAWETPLPDWVRALAEAADASSQREVGRRIDYSPAVVNQVLGRTYGGDLGAFAGLLGHRDGNRAQPELPGGTPARLSRAASQRAGGF